MSVSYQLDGDVAIIEFDRSDRFNAIESTLSEGTIAALDRAGNEARAVVITGKGRAFCSGADLADLIDDYRRDGPDLFNHLEKVFHPLVEALIAVPVPTVAAVNGVAAGAGLGVALACDVRVMAETATLTSAFTGIGLAPDSGATWWLPQMVGVSKALELTFTNRRVTASEALQMGLCMDVVDDGELRETAVRVAQGFADLPPDALVTTRKLIRDAAGLPFADAIRAEQVEQGRLGRTAEHLEGVNAFLDKRKPDYRTAADKLTLD